MSSLVQNLKIFFPETPDPPDSKVLEISAALDLAMLQHIITSYVPAGFGNTFSSGVSNPTAFIISLGSYLNAVISPILSSALSIESTPGSNKLLAWGAVQPSFDALLGATPPFMAGIDGFRLWQAILVTIRTALVPAFPIPVPEIDSDSGGDGIITLEDEI